MVEGELHTLAGEQRAGGPGRGRGGATGGRGGPLAPAGGVVRSSSGGSKLFSRFEAEVRRPRAPFHLPRGLCSGLTHRPPAILQLLRARPTHMAPRRCPLPPPKGHGDAAGQRDVLRGAR
jgi:hypothetical protein